MDARKPDGSKIRGSPDAVISRCGETLILFAYERRFEAA
jgi:hypothetical protein